MRIRASQFILSLALTIAATLPAAGAELSVIVRGDGGKLLSDAVVWLMPVGGPAPAARDTTATMDQKNRTFVPHVLAVQVGTSVRFPNSDNVRHQVYSFSPPKAFQLPLYIGEPANPVVFDKPGIVALGCNIHDQMSAWIVVVETPWFARTGEAGEVHLRDLPAGSYTIHSWHPRMSSDQEPLKIDLDQHDQEMITIGIRAR